MLRTVYTPNSNYVNVSIPDRYVGMELEILVPPINEILIANTENKPPKVDISFGGWSDMDKSTEEICSEIRASRAFRNRELNLV